MPRKCKHALCHVNYKQWEREWQKMVDSCRSQGIEPPEQPKMFGFPKPNDPNSKDWCEKWIKACDDLAFPQTDSDKWKHDWAVCEMHWKKEAFTVGDTEVWRIPYTENPGGKKTMAMTKPPNRIIRDKKELDILHCINIYYNKARAAHIEKLPKGTLIPEPDYYELAKARNTQPENLHIYLAKGRDTKTSQKAFEPKQPSIIDNQQLYESKFRISDFKSLVKDLTQNAEKHFSNYAAGVMFFFWRFNDNVF